MNKDNARRRVLERGLLACYEIIDMIRKEMAELDAARDAEKLEKQAERDKKLSPQDSPK